MITYMLHAGERLSFLPIVYYESVITQKYSIANYSHFLTDIWMEQTSNYRLIKLNTMKSMQWQWDLWYEERYTKVWAYDVMHRQYGTERNIPLPIYCVDYTCTGEPLLKSMVNLDFCCLSRRKGVHDTFYVINKKFISKYWIIANSSKSQSILGALKWKKNSTWKKKALPSSSTITTLNSLRFNGPKAWFACT